jgi:hypothetical protein
MSSEEMREELESFVNQGIEEGWGGWPLKGWSLQVDDCRLQCRPEFGEMDLLERVLQRPLLVGGRLSRLFQTDLQDVNRLS